MTSPQCRSKSESPASNGCGESGSVKIELNRDWTEFLCVLIARRVRFLVIGGHAVAGHGEPRLTEDLDVFVDRNAQNAQRLHEALVDFGFGGVAPQPKELARPHKVFMLGRKPWRIDILTSIDGVSFKEAWASRVSAQFVATPLYVIGREMLIKNKRAAAREKDLGDVALLEAHAPPLTKRRRSARNVRVAPARKRKASK